MTERATSLLELFRTQPNFYQAFVDCLNERTDIRTFHVRLHECLQNMKRACEISDQILSEQLGECKNEGEKQEIIKKREEYQKLLGHVNTLYKSYFGGKQ